MLQEQNMPEIQMEKAENPIKEIPYINNHLVLAILSMIYCCLPFGIISLVYASKVNTLMLMGKIQAAEQASSSAKTWGIVALIAGCSFWLIYLGFVFFTFIFAYLAENNALN